MGIVLRRLGERSSITISIASTWSLLDMLDHRAPGNEGDEGDEIHEVHEGDEGGR